MAKRAKKVKTQAELDREVRAERLKRFRILVCVDGSEESFQGVRFARKFMDNRECDIVLLYVRRIDQGMNSGGLQMRVARQNLLDWGLELPGIEYLKKARDLLIEDSELKSRWKRKFAHSDVFGDPLGDNKVEYRSPRGRGLVLKLKTAPDVPGGILHQTELGPYNLVITGPPQHWSHGWRYYVDPNIVQKVSRLAPGGVMAVRDYEPGSGFMLTFDGTARNARHMRRGAVLANYLEEEVVLFSAVDPKSDVTDRKAYLESIAEMYASDGIKVADIRLARGRPAEQVLQYGSNCSAIVVSDTANSRFTRFFRSSIAFNIMGQARITVLNLH
ncbi:MAG: universal stress protein [Pseudomonadota bacterium]